MAEWRYNTTLHRQLLFWSGVGLILTGILVSMVNTPYTGAQPNNPTIGQIQANPNIYIDRIVTLRGTVAIVLDLNEFLLDDGTGQIVVDAGPPWYAQINVPRGATVTVTGEIDHMGPPGNRRGIDLDACRIEGPEGTIEIRDCSFTGPPPWAGGRGRGQERGRPPRR